MVANSPPTVIAIGLALLVVSYLIRERGWHFLIAGVGFDDSSVPSWIGDVVGAYTAVVGVVTVALGLLAFAGLAPDLLWSAYGVVVALSALTLPFWAPRYVAWRLDGSAAA